MFNVCRQPALAFVIVSIRTSIARIPFVIPGYNRRVNGTVNDAAQY